MLPLLYHRRKILPICASKTLSWASRRLIEPKVVANMTARPTIGLIIDPWDFSLNATVVSTRRFADALTRHHEASTAHLVHLYQKMLEGNLSVSEGRRCLKPDRP